MKNKIHKVSSDKNLNPRLAKQIGSLRGCMVGAAEKNKLPKRFKVTPHPDHPRMIIKDTTSGRETIVPLFAYGAVREALMELFPK